MIDNMLRVKKVVYHARSYFLHGKVKWHLAFDFNRSRYFWTKDSTKRSAFHDHNHLVDAIAEAGGPDAKDKGIGGWIGTRRVIITTTTVEEHEFKRIYKVAS
jgi:hypothetical protein